MDIVLTLLTDLFLKPQTPLTVAFLLRIYYEFSSGQPGGPRFKPSPQPVNPARNLTVEDLSENGSELSTLNKSKRLLVFPTARPN
ncbi:hypothetical protein FJ875_26715 [Salmonella enterica]|nr:hypothetical protein [Salmonella enterica]